MKDLLTSVEFWIAMGFASIVKIKASPKLTVVGSLTTIGTAVAAALVFTGPLMDYLQLSGDIYVAAVAALVALSAEHICRQILDINLIDLLRAWRGK